MNLIPLDVGRPIWDRFFTVAPLVVVGSKEPDGSYDLAPKHMAMPLGWQNYYAFVCSPRHATYRNIRRERQFTVSFPRPTEIVASSLAASPRCQDGFGAHSLIVGEIVAASASEDYLRMDDRDGGEQLFNSPLLVYVSPGRYAELRETAQFPLPAGFSR
jgi:flavin reductase (DIM6/NTAB) family NADH-FMN oxidoreductase RutF